MRYVDFAPLARRVSTIGFGCASLGSRISARQGGEALARAYDAGISWFDVAPSYGDGNAEALLGRFLAGKRSRVAICTKVGFLPGRSRFAARLVTPVARHVVASLPRLRKYVAKVRPFARRVRLNGSFIEASIVQSLKRLQTDYVDVIGLHEVDLGDMEREDVLEALENIVSKGYARTVSVAGDVRVAVAAVALSDRVRIIQIANSPFVPNLALARHQLTAVGNVAFVTHGVYGHDGPLDAFTSMIANDANKRALMNSMGYAHAPRKAAVAFLLDFALSSNPDGVVLLSMCDSQHLSFDIGRLTASPPSETVLDLADRLVTSSRLQLIRRGDWRAE
jgi:aryl-alcohol dehydrogenase-like predicted oxidoreductase